MYLEVEERRERRPGTEQKMSVGKHVMFSFISRSRQGKSGVRGEEREGGRESWESMEARWC